MLVTKYIQFYNKYAFIILKNLCGFIFSHIDKFKSKKSPKGQVALVLKISVNRAVFHHCRFLFLEGWLAISRK